MAYDDGLAEIMRGDFADIPGISERKMFGGLAFLLDGHMVCGVHAGGGIYRVGKPREDGTRETTPSPTKPTEIDDSGVNSHPV